MKYVNITDEAVVLTLKCAKHYGSLRCIRERAHGLLLGNRGFTLEQIAEILEIKYQTASQWIDDWEDYGIRALYKRHGGGRPCICDESEVQRIKELVAEEPRRLSYVKSKIEDETGKSSSKLTLANIVKKLGLVYKRLRKSCKHKRDKEHFQRCCFLFPTNDHCSSISKIMCTVAFSKGSCVTVGGLSFLNGK